MSKELERVLIVDDDVNLLKGLKRNLNKYYDIDIASGGEEALALFESDGPYQVLLVDMNMPLMNGIELLEEARKIDPTTIPLMLTGNSDQATAVQAINQGKVFHFFNKPCPAEEIRKFIDDAMNEYNLSLTQGPHSNQMVESALNLIQDLAARSSPYSAQHIAQLREIVSKICKAIPEADEEVLLQAVPMITLYLSYLPSSIRQSILRHRPLKIHQQKAVSNALSRARKLLESVPPLSLAADSIYYHLKNYNGHGVPIDNAREQDLPLGARILRIAVDCVELTQQGLEERYAIAKLCRRIGVYDPKILDALI